MSKIRVLCARIENFKYHFFAFNFVKDNHYLCEVNRNAKKIISDYPNAKYDDNCF